MALPPALGGTLECVALIAIGYNLRKLGIFDAADAQTAQKIAGYVTLPAALLHAGSSAGGLGWQALAGAPLVLLAAAASAGITWARTAKRHKRERALLCGCSAGGAAAAVALPFIEATMGAAGVAAAAAALAANAVAVQVISYLLMGSAGPAFPEAYKHEDGGVYRGEWRGMSKEGLGAYTYASGARYEGEWHSNVKDGRGVYYYPKGGTYEGEWSGGAMNGVGVRTYSTGRVVAGRWRDNQLERPLELWQCAPAAEGAAEAALAARGVPVGGGAPRDAAAGLVRDPVLWAAAGGAALAVTGAALPPALCGVAAALAPANKPLMLMSAGMALSFTAPQTRQAADVFALVATRLGAALFLSSIALAFLGAALPSTLYPLLAALLVLLAPAPPAARGFARMFRLNEALAEAAVAASAAAGVVSIAAAAAGAAAAGLLLAAGGGVEAAAGGAAAAAAAQAAAATNYATCLLAAAALLAVAAAPVYDRLRTDRQIKLVYAGAGGQQGQQQQQPGQQQQQLGQQQQQGQQGQAQQGQQGQAPEPGAAGGGGGGAGAGGAPGGAAAAAAGGGRRASGGAREPGPLRLGRGFPRGGLGGGAPAARGPAARAHVARRRRAAGGAARAAAAFGARLAA